MVKKQSTLNTTQYGNKIRKQNTGIKYGNKININLTTTHYIKHTLNTTQYIQLDGYKNKHQLNQIREQNTETKYGKIHTNKTNNFGKIKEANFSFILNHNGLITTKALKLNTLQRKIISNLASYLPNKAIKFILPSTQIA